MYLLAADGVLFLHVSFVLFVVLALLAIIVGKWRGWSWVRNRRFRIVHLLAIGFVVVQTWLGEACPLTILEMELRAKGGDAVYTGDFIAHWMARLLYYDLPTWVFALAYTAFGAAVVVSWFWVRPNKPFEDQ